METSGRGRPRSAAAHRAILEAARELLLADGYERLTIAGIADRAGVGRQTVYRRWPSKSGIVAEAVLDGYLAIGAGRPEDDESESGLREWVRGLAAAYATPSASGIVRALAAAAAERDDDAARLYAELNAPARAALLGALRRAVARGEVRPDADLEAATDAVFGAVLYRVLTLRPAAPHELEALVELILEGIGPRAAARR